MDSAVVHRRDSYVGLAWGVLIFTIIVIISGDIVQATESGAGCGETWPRCDGSLIPSISDLQTGIEFTHRMVTAALSLGYIALTVGAWRRRGWEYEGGESRWRVLTPGGFADAYRRSAPVWRAAVWAVVFFIIEVILGALLVVFGWVENDASIGRVIVDSVHLVNTFAMVATLTLVLFHAKGGGRLRLDTRRTTGKLVLAGAGVITIVGISGAINSLADALYFAEEVDVETTPIASILVSIRGIHPVVAIVGGVAIFMLTRYLAAGRGPREQRIAVIIQGVVWVQFVVGFLNIALSTPLETQVVHLVAAHTMWALFVYLSALMLEETPVAS